MLEQVEKAEDDKDKLRAMNNSAVVKQINNIGVGVDVYQKHEGGDLTYAGKATGNLTSTSRYGLPNAAQVETPQGELISVPFNKMVIGGVSVERRELI